MMDYRSLREGELIEDEDEVEASNGFNDPPLWEKTTTGCVGTTVPDPKYPAHRQYRRAI